MFGLGQHVCGRPRGIDGAVGHDHDFGGTGDHVDGDAAVDEAFGRRDVGVAGADDLLDGRDGLRAVGERGDGRGSAHLVDGGRAGFHEGVEGGRVHGAVLAGRGGRDDLAHAGGLRDGDRVNGAGDQRSGAAGDVATDAFHRRELFAQRDARPRLREPVLRDLHGGELTDVRDGVFHGVTGLLRDGGLRGLDLGVGDFQLGGGQLDPVEFRDLREDGLVAVQTDFLHDGLRPFLDLGGACRTRIERLERLSIIRIGAVDDFHGGNPFF